MSWILFLVAVSSAAADDFAFAPPATSEFAGIDPDVVAAAAFGPPAPAFPEDLTPDVANAPHAPESSPSDLGAPDTESAFASAQVGSTDEGEHAPPPLSLEPLPSSPSFSPPLTPSFSAASLPSFTPISSVSHSPSSAPYAPATHVSHGPPPRPIPLLSHTPQNSLAAIPIISYPPISSIAHAPSSFAPYPPPGQASNAPPTPTSSYGPPGYTPPSTLPSNASPPPMLPPPPPPHIQSHPHRRPRPTPAKEYGAPGRSDEDNEYLLNDGTVISENTSNNGNFRFRYVTPDGSSRSEIGTTKQLYEGHPPVFVVRGAYSYVNPQGKNIRVQYIADENGFNARPA